MTSDRMLPMDGSAFFSESRPEGPLPKAVIGAVALLLAFLAVDAFFQARWGPHLDDNGDPPSAYDGTDTFGFPFVHRYEPGGNCEFDPCGMITVDDATLRVNLGIAAAALVVVWIGLWFVLFRFRPWRVGRWFIGEVRNEFGGKWGEENPSDVPSVER